MNICSKEPKRTNELKIFILFFSLNKITTINYTYFVFKFLVDNLSNKTNELLEKNSFFPNSYNMLCASYPKEIDTCSY